MHLRRLPLLAGALALAAAGFAPIPPPKPGRPSQVSAKALEGTWKVLKYETARGKGVTALTTYSRVVIKGRTWTQMRSARANTSPGPSYTFTLDTRKSPAQIDMMMDSAKGTTRGARRGVLELKKDRLTVSYGMVSNNSPRPKSPGDPLVGLQYRWVLQREKP